ncbi:MAG TPA: TolC family protein [Burkholderiales bacterium]|nr:TolC family protein [Burkholderiales bacterium]
MVFPKIRDAAIARPQSFILARAAVSSAAKALFVLAGLLATASGAAAQSSLTLADAQRRAVEQSGQVSARDAAVLASREMAAAAGRLPDPVLRLGVDNLPVDGSDRFSLTADSMTMRRVGVMQEFTRSEKRQLRAQRFEREAEKSLAEKSAAIADIRRDAALAWLDRYYAERAAAVVAQQKSEAGREIAAIEGAYRGGRGSQADVIAAHAGLAALDDRAAETDRQIRTAKAWLSRWIGEAGEAPLAGKPDIDVIGLDSNAIDTQLAHHPEIAVLARQEEIAAIEARLAEADKRADWTVEIAYSQRGSMYSNMVSVGVSVPLQWDQKRRQDREVASKLAQVEQAKAQRQDMLRAHVAEVRAMVVEWQSGRERLDRYARELVPLAAERTRAALAAYQGGRSSLSDLLLARRDELEARLQAVQLERETARLWAQLNFLVPDDADHADAATLREVK